MQFWYNVFVVHNASANDRNVTVIAAVSITILLHFAQNLH